MSKPTLAELEEILDRKDYKIEIRPDGSITATSPTEELERQRSYAGRLAEAIEAECEWLAQRREEAVAADYNILACRYDERRCELAAALAKNPTDQAGSAKAAGAPGAESTAAPTNADVSLTGRFVPARCCPVTTTCEREKACSGMCPVRCRPQFTEAMKRYAQTLLHPDQENQMCRSCDGSGMDEILRDGTPCPDCKGETK